MEWLLLKYSIATEVRYDLPLDGFSHFPQLRLAGSNHIASYRWCLATVDQFNKWRHQLLISDVMNWQLTGGKERAIRLVENLWTKNDNSHNSACKLVYSAWWPTANIWIALYPPRCRSYRKLGPKMWYFLSPSVDLKYPRPCCASHFVFTLHLTSFYWISYYAKVISNIYIYLQEKLHGWKLIPQ